MKRQMSTLTVRQREVLKLIAEDCTAKEMAARLKLSYKGVQYHGTRLRRTFNCGVAGLTRLAIVSGLVKLKPIK